MKRFLALLLLAGGLLVAGGAKANVLYQSAQEGPYGNNPTSYFSYANKITLSSYATVTSLIITAVGQSPLDVSLCQDVAGQPANCVSMTMQGSFPVNMYAPVTYNYNTGFHATANQPFWVTFNNSIGNSTIIQSSGGVGYVSSIPYPYSQGNNLNEFFITISGSLIPAPTVNLSTAGLAINATTLTIAGTNFDTTAGNNTVVFTNLGAVGSVSAATATQLTVTFTTPPNSTGSMTAVVTTNGQSSGSAVQVATVVLATQATLVVVPTLSSINVNGTTTLSTTGGSGSGAVSYTLVSGPCTLNVATLTGTGAGSCFVTATKAADSTYASAMSSQVTVAVSLAPASIPSLSEWTQLLLALMVLSIIGWHFHKQRSY